jgi:hypothetical protein
MEADREKMAARLEVKIDANHVKTIASQERTIDKMDAWLAEMKDGREKTTACKEAMEAYPEKTEANSEDMESRAEHREVPKKYAAVETGRASNKRPKPQSAAKSPGISWQPAER